VIEDQGKGGIIALNIKKNNLVALIAPRNSINNYKIYNK
jgi:hypothetical protein